MITGEVLSIKRRYCAPCIVNCDVHKSPKDLEMSQAHPIRAASTVKKHSTSRARLATLVRSEEVE